MELRWLLVFQGLAFCAAACPNGCTCHHDKGLYTASCSDVPTNAGRVEVLNILPSRQWDNPQELMDGQFNQGRHLKYLNLKNNYLYFIHKKAFYGAKDLIEIDLSFNYIEELDPLLFQHLTSLTTLKLRGNPIQLESEVPFVVSNSIHNLDIGECKLKNVPRGVFYGLKRLKYLSMDGNHLKSLKYNSLPKGLTYINLSKNFITNVPSEALSSLTNLRKINLGKNPINCSCSLMNLQDWLLGRGVVFEGNIICASPQEYFGVSSSKVNENRLCLIKARRDELAPSSDYNKLFKNKLNNGKHFVHENSYSEENIQADQPQLLHPDTQAEVLFQNNDTRSMGEMMRDEEIKEIVTITEIPETDIHITTSLEKEKDINTKEIIKEDKDEKHQNEHQLNDKLEDSNTSAEKNYGKKTEETENPEMSNPTKNSKTQTAEYTNSNAETTIFSPADLEDGKKSENETSDVITPQPDNLNGNNTVVYKHLNEEEQFGETDDLKQEGFIVGGDSKYKGEANSTFEEGTTDIPDIEITSEVEGTSTDESPTANIEEKSELEGTTNNLPSFFEQTNATVLENNTLETKPPPSSAPEVFVTNDAQNVSDPNRHLDEVDNASPGNPENKSLQDTSLSNNPIEQKIKEVHGAEVLMFCLGVLVICLILYSVYKCRRSSNKRTISRTAKDMESSRSTEMQDMASLIPKPADDTKKNLLKYPDKGTSSENVKLITENENESPGKNVDNDSKAKPKREDKNSLNNNTSSSPTSKTPLLKPENPITINPAEPIQRTRVKVGIIPDSIPRTPIFVQKTLNNGTKHV